MLPLDGYALEALNIGLALFTACLYGLGLIEGRLGRAFFLAGLLCHVLGIGIRWLVLGRPPLAEKHDTVSLMALGAALAYLYYSARSAPRDLGLLAIPIVAVLLLVSLGWSPTDSISPFLESPWFYLHIGLYCASYGLMAVSSSAGLLYVLRGGTIEEALCYRAASAGWITLSASLFCGSVWFYEAYGTYWLWTSREMWISILWFFYGLYLHARLLKGLRGRPAGAIGAIGFWVALFTYFGVGTVIPSPPTAF